MAVLWDVTPCNLLDIYLRFIGDYFYRRLEDGGSKHQWNVGKLLPDYTALHLRRQPSSHIPPENLISHRHLRSISLTVLVLCVFTYLSFRMNWNESVQS
jgi:hypothetical protein